jgi:uncharacterized protein
VAEAAPHELRIDIADILEQFAESVTYEGDILLDPIEIGAERFVPISPARIEAELTFAGSGVVASGSVSVDAQATCSRCLREFVLPVKAPIEGFYVQPGVEHDLPEEQEVELVGDRSIDLLPAVHAAVVLEMPFAPLHDPACAGICPTCGADLNELLCTCERNPGDSPFAALKQLLDGGDEPA